MEAALIQNGSASIWWMFNAFWIGFYYWSWCREVGVFQSRAPAIDKLSVVYRILFFHSVVQAHQTLFLPKVSPNAVCLCTLSLSLTQVLETFSRIDTVSSQKWCSVLWCVSEGRAELAFLSLHFRLFRSWKEAFLSSDPFSRWMHRPFLQDRES